MSHQLQDLPPPQGFPSVVYRRDLPKRGISGWAMFGVGAVVMIGGFYVMGKQNTHTRAVQQELRRRRLNVSSVLQAEEDRRYLRALLKTWEEEEKLMAGRKDWVVGKPVYETTYALPHNVVVTNQ